MITTAFSASTLRKRRKAWLEALRSGKFKQAEGTLRSGAKGRCCLGVYCDANPTFAKWDPDYESTALVRVKGEEEPFDGDFAGMAHLLGLTEEQHNFLVLHNDGSLSSELNPNSEKWSFKKIADWIEENVK